MGLLLDLNQLGIGFPYPYLPTVHDRRVYIFRHCFMVRQAGIEPTKRYRF